MRYKHCLSAVALLVASNTYAGQPVWTFEALTPTTVSLPRNSTTTVQYRVTNQSSKTHVLAMKPITGVTQTTEDTGSCPNPFTLIGGASCLLTLEVNGSQVQGNLSSGPDVCESGSALQCYQPSAANSLNITVTNALTVAGIAVLNKQVNFFWEGRPTALIIKNTSTDIVAKNIAADFTGTVFEGKIESVSNTCGTVRPGGQCIQRLRPTSLITESPRDAFFVMGTNTVSTTVVGAQYKVGDPYQGGVIGCLSDTDDLQNLIAANSDAFVDGSTLIRWAGYRTETQAQSETDGAINTPKIVDVLGDNGGTSYAAKVCTGFGFLPAKAQLACLYANRGVIGGFDSNRYYWSSTELPNPDDRFYAWIQYFRNGEQVFGRKDMFDPVRCVKAIADE